MHAVNAGRRGPAALGCATMTEEDDAVFTHRILKFWPQKGKLGINRGPLICHACGAPGPKVRLPKSFRQMVWGGWDCRACGARLDKYGRPDET